MTRSSPFATAAAAKELLHAPVLKAVESDDRQAAARLQHCFSSLQTAFQLVQFAIEVNADRLKRPRRRVLLVASAIAHGLPHDGGKRAGAASRPCLDKRDRKSVV